MISYYFCGKQLYFVNPAKNVAILILTGLNTFEIDCRRKKEDCKPFLTYPYRPNG